MGIQFGGGFENKPENTPLKFFHTKNLLLERILATKLVPGLILKNLRT